jgi:Fe-S cluster assembly protein SufD
VTQELNRNSKLIRFSDSTLAASSNAKLAVVHTGAKWVREETYSTVSGSDAKSEILSVTLPDTGQEYDQRTFQHHGARNTFSDLLFKNTLFGKATTIFSGLIFVDEGAHGTDAYQTCRNLMMTDECEAHSMPGLEINADDVKCSHGSTSSRVSDEEIFYLMARGITAKDARGLVAQGFSIEAIERLEDEQLETLAVEVVARKFAIVE